MNVSPIVLETTKTAWKIVPARLTVQQVVPVQIFNVKKQLRYQLLFQPGVGKCTKKYEKWFLVLVQSTEYNRPWYRGGQKSTNDFRKSEYKDVQISKFFCTLPTPGFNYKCTRN